MFGLHLAKVFADAEVCLVESEKTAVICSAFCDPNKKIWMACGGLQFFKPEMIAEATRNARKTAEQFAEDSESELGKIKTADQGQFSIEDRDQNTPWLKNIRVVTTVVYYLED